MPARSLFDDIRRIALASVDSPDWDYVERRERRRFSERFHTPLPEVDKLDLAYVLLNLYESDFEEMAPAARAGAARLLTRPPEEEEEEMSALDEDDAWAAEEIRKIQAEEAAKAAAKAKAAAASVDKAAESLEALARSLPRSTSVDFGKSPPDKE